MIWYVKETYMYIALQVYLLRACYLLIVSLQKLFIVNLNDVQYVRR